MKTIILGYSLFFAVSTVSNFNVYANDDVSKGKTKANACIGCHGSNGIGLGSEFPNLAGQKKLYLIKQLKDFRDGSRVDPTMKAIASTLSDTDIKNLSSYYSGLNSTSLKHVSKTSTLKNNKPLTEKATKNEFKQPVYVSMKKSATVESFPGEQTWKGGPNMLYIAVTPDGKKVLSTSPSTNSVYVFNSKTGKQLAVIKVGKAPKGVKVTPNGKYAYVSNQNSANISVIDLHSLTVVDTISVREGPHNARFTKDGKLAYVTLQGGDGLAIIDTAKRKMIQVIPVPGITGPHNIDLSLDENTAFVRDFVHNVAIVDLKTQKVKKVIKVGNGHGGIDVSPSGRYVSTAAIGANFITVINTNDFTSKNIIVGNGPHGIRSSSDSRWIYVTVTKDNLIAVIDANNMQVVKKIAVGKFPFWVAVKDNP